MHFFIDPHGLPIQDSIKKYGVIDVNKYRVTSSFDLETVSPAYAMQKGTLIIQPHATESSLVNIMIKSRGKAEGVTNTVSYFVYRGIRRDSLFSNESSLLPKSSFSNSHFLHRLWSSYETTPSDYDELEPGGPSLADVGFDTTLTDTIPVSNIFMETISGVHAAVVHEGDEIGLFDVGEIGIEIITHHVSAPEAVSGNQVDLAYLRKAFHEIDLTGLTDIERDATKELVHRYIDPAAFFGGMYHAGVRHRDNQSGIVMNYRRQELYNNIVSKFATRNIVYLDIRNDSGYSYNFYNKYGDQQGYDLRVTDNNENTQSLSYGTDGWPILALDGKIKDFSVIGLSLRLDSITNPVLFAEYIQIDEVYNRQFISSDALIDGSTVGWTKDAKFSFQRVEADNTIANIATYLGMQYFDYGSKHDPLEIDAPYNNAFCSINLVNMDNEQSIFTFAQQTECTYTNSQLPNSDLAFAYAADAGVNWDERQVVFYASSVYTEERSGVQDSDYTPTKNEGLSLTGRSNNQSFLVNDLSLYKIEIQEVQNNNEFHQVSILNLQHNGSNNGGYEDVMFLGITRAEYISLIETPGLNEYHHSYPYLEKISSSMLEDREGINYDKFRLGLINIDANREWKTSFPSANIVVYTMDLLAFASEEFASATIINETELPLVKNLIKIRNAHRIEGSFEVVDINQTWKGDRVFIAGHIFPFIHVKLNNTSPNEWIWVNQITLENNSETGPDSIYGSKRINISNGKAYIYIPEDVLEMGFSYSQSLYAFLTNVQPSSEVLRGEFPDYATYLLAFGGQAKALWWMDGKDGIWLKEHRKSKNTVWKNAMAAIVESQWTGVLAPFEQIGDFYGYLDQEMKRKGHEIKWQRGAKVLVDALAENKLLWAGGLEEGSFLIRNNVEIILNELNLGICDFAISKFHELIHVYLEPVVNEHAYHYDYSFIVHEQQNVAKPIYDKASIETIKIFQDIVDKNWRGGSHGWGSRLFSRTTPAFNAFTRPAKVTDDLFRTDLPLLMLYLERHTPNSDSFKHPDGTLDYNYKNVIRSGDIFNGFKSFEIS